MDSKATQIPSEAVQRRFWDQWNDTHRGRPGHLDGLMRRQFEIALQWAHSVPNPRRVLDVGCGVGWLAAQLQSHLHCEAMGVDLSPNSIEAARKQYPTIHFMSGDFAEMNLNGMFDFIASADVIAHVPNQARFVDKIASLLPPGGIFVLMTQNPFVWNRSSYLQPAGEGQIRNWPSLSVLKKLFRPHFAVIHESSIVPGGDRGILRVANSYKLKKFLHGTIGETHTTALYEQMFIGRELVLVGKRL